MRWTPVCRVGAVAFLVASSSLVARGVESSTIDLNEVAKKVRPAVVSLVVYGSSGQELAGGTGFLVSDDGKVVTSRHLLKAAARVVATDGFNHSFPVEGVLAEDSRQNLALLKIKTTGLPSVSLGSSEEIQSGHRVAVVSSPTGLEGMPSVGIVSDVLELLDGYRVIRVIAAVTTARDGSPVVNAEGKLIGVATDFFAEARSLDFAIPVESVKALLARAESATSPASWAQFSRRGDNHVWLDPDARACIAAGLEDDAKLLNHARAVARKFPDHAAGYFFLGVAHFRLKAYDESVKAFQKALELKPDDEITWVSLGWTYFDQLKYDESEAACRRAIALDSGDAEAWSRLGRVYLRQKKHVAALEACRRAADLEPNNPDLWSEVGNASVCLNKYDESTAAFERADRLRAEQAKAWCEVGSSFVWKRQYVRSVHAFEQAIKLNPRQPGALYQLSLTYALQGENQKAWETAGKLQSLDPARARELRALLAKNNR